MGPEVVEEEAKDSGGGEDDGRWTNVDGPNGSYDESLLKLAEQSRSGLVDHPLWSARGRPTGHSEGTTSASVNGWVRPIRGVARNHLVVYSQW